MTARFRIHVGESWYRDVWLLAITGVLIATMWTTVTTSNHASRLATELQRNRLELIRGNCENLNARHDGTLAALTHVLALASRHASRQRLAQIRQSRSSTVLLIDALAPHQDCARVVRAAELSH